MFRKKNGNTRMGSVERLYGVDFNVRSDTELGNLLHKRGFNSLTQLVNAAKGNAKAHARKRRCFISFHQQDFRKVDGLRLMARNPHLALDFYDSSVRVPVSSEKASYVRSKIGAKIAAASVVVCVVGNATGWRDWVDWELTMAFQLGKGLCGVRIPQTFGRYPEMLALTNAPIAAWDAQGIVAAIEQAAALRS